MSADLAHVRHPLSCSGPCVPAPLVLQSYLAENLNGRMGSRVDQGMNAWSGGGPASSTSPTRARRLPPSYAADPTLMGTMELTGQGRMDSPVRRAKGARISSGGGADAGAAWNYAGAGAGYGVPGELSQSVDLGTVGGAGAASQQLLPGGHTSGLYSAAAAPPNQPVAGAARPAAAPGPHGCVLPDLAVCTSAPCSPARRGPLSAHAPAAAAHAHSADVPSPAAAWSSQHAPQLQLQLGAGTGGMLAPSSALQSAHLAGGYDGGPAASGYGYAAGSPRTDDVSLARFIGERHSNRREVGAVSVRPGQGPFIDACLGVGWGWGIRLHAGHKGARGHAALGCVRLIVSRPWV